MKDKKLIIVAVMVTFLFVVTFQFAFNVKIRGKEKWNVETTKASIEANTKDIEQEEWNAEIDETALETNLADIEKEAQNVETTKAVLDNNTVDEDNDKRSYDSFSSSFFPYDGEIKFVNEEVFEIIKSAYDKIDFYGEFQTGNTETYDYYKKKYLKLIKGDADFYDRETGEKLSLTDLQYDINGEDCLYMFFDMSGDGNPELSVTDGTSFRYVFEYIPESDRFILWANLESTWYGLMGTQKVFWTRFIENNIFYKLDKNGEPECTVFFHSKITENEKTGEKGQAYMVSLPEYVNKPVEYTKAMKLFRYFDEYHQVYCFRVTEEQYYQLVNDYFVSLDLAEERIQAVTYTYDGLFGDLAE